MPEIAAPDQSATGLTAALAALAGKESAKTRRALAGVIAASAAIKQARRLYERIRTETSFAVAISGGDDIFEDVHEWLLSLLQPARQRSLAVRTGRRDDKGGVEVGQRTQKALKVLYDSSKTQTVTLDGHRVKVGLWRPERTISDMRALDEMPRWARDMERIVFTATDLAGRDAVLRFLRGVVEEQSKRQPALYIADQWGNWNRRSEMADRPLETVVLRAGQKENLVADLEEFLGQEPAYRRLGIPYHRGYLFHGPPGTGKTSIAKALANHFHLDVYYIPLPALRDDGRLIECLNRVEPLSVLLMEDIDVVHGSRVRDDSDPGVTLSGLLNALDGLVTPHGLITIMTTNDLAVIDQAIVRPGRVDRLEEMGYVDWDQLTRLVSTFVGDATKGRCCPSVTRDLAPAEVIETVKRHLDDSEAAWDALLELLA